jgi:hypothetical protein
MIALACQESSESFAAGLHLAVSDSGFWFALLEGNFAEIKRAEPAKAESLK